MMSILLIVDHNISSSLSLLLISSSNLRLLVMILDVVELVHFDMVDCHQYCIFFHSNGDVIVLYIGQRNKSVGYIAYW
jgi:hypothetical protein